MPPSRRTCARSSPRAKKRERVELTYASASRHQAETRPVDPYGIVHHAGEWYVVGFCHKRGDVRTFRIDRIASLRPMGEKFERPADFDLEAYRRERLYVPSADAVNVRDRARSARRDADRGELARRRGHDAATTARPSCSIDCEGFEWVTGWVLGLGRHARIVGPAEARAAMRERIDRLRGDVASA